MDRDNALPELTAMSMGDHIAELRNRLILCVSALAVAFVVAFYFASPLINLLKLVVPSSVVFVQLSPGEALLASVRIAVMAGLVLASPVLLHQLFSFVLPGLSLKEQRFLVGIMLGGAALFVFGVCFAYALVLPPALAWLLDFGQDIAVTQMSIAQFLEFCTGILLLNGILFELPLVLFFLAAFGLIQAEQLLSQWRWAIVGVFVLAAVLTPSQDPVTLLLVGGMMGILYFFTAIVIALVYGRESGRASEGRNPENKIAQADS